MDQLPQEIIDLVIANVERRKIVEDPGATCTRLGQKVPLALPPLATISQKWKSAVEKLTFRSVSLRSDELSTFETIFTAQ